MISQFLPTVILCIRIRQKGNCGPYKHFYCSTSCYFEQSIVPLYFFRQNQKGPFSMFLNSFLEIIFCDQDDYERWSLTNQLLVKYITRARISLFYLHNKSKTKSKLQLC